MILRVQGGHFLSPQSGLITNLYLPAVGNGEFTPSILKFGKL